MSRVPAKAWSLAIRSACFVAFIVRFLGGVVLVSPNIDDRPC
jgi:hypothetical protein